jgi:PTS system galactitol-specific IIA component
MIWETIDKKTLNMDIDAGSSTEVLVKLGNLLIINGYCKSSFIPALLKRERDNPTGIDMGGFGIAIPHTDVSHVTKDGMAIGVLKKPVEFTAMGTDDESVDVLLVFVLAITNPSKHLGQIQTLISTLQDKKVLEDIWGAKTPDEIIDIFKNKETLP